MGYFLPDGVIENLKQYRYQSEDRSIISRHLLKPFWLWFEQIFPSTMAPNLITLSGLGFVIFNVILVMIYDPFLNQESPRWVYFAHAFGIFMYQTFDGCDGIHARRINQSGPLGELFDHSIDSINTTLCLLIFSSMIGSGYSYLTLYSQFALLCNFYLSTWEEYHTHTLFLSEFSGPVEGILGICFAFILTAIMGPDLLWHTNIFNITLWNGMIIGFDTSHLFLVLSSIGLLFNIYTARSNVIKYYSGEKILLNERANIKQAMQGLLPFFIYYLTIVIIVYIEPEFLSFAFMSSIGLSIAFVVGRIIVHHLTKQDFPMFNISTVIPLVQLSLYLIVVNIFDGSSKQTAHALSWLGFGLSLGIHGFFMNEIIHKFTSYLDIYALTIKHHKKI